MANLTYQITLVDGDGKPRHVLRSDGVSFPCDERNPEYRQFLADGEKAEAFVPPQAPTPMTARQKVERLASIHGLTFDELKSALTR